MLDLLDEGTTTRNANQLAEEQERLGASLNVGASMDRSAANLSVVTANLAPSLTLMADVLRHPAFAPSEVERLRAQRLAALASEATQPGATPPPGPCRRCCGVRCGQPLWPVLHRHGRCRYGERPDPG